MPLFNLTEAKSGIAEAGINKIDLHRGSDVFSSFNVKAYGDVDQKGFFTYDYFDHVIVSAKIQLAQVKFSLYQHGSTLRKSVQMPFFRNHCRNMLQFRNPYGWHDGLDEHRD